MTTLTIFTAFQLLVENNLAPKLHNVTVFLPRWSPFLIFITISFSRPSGINKMLNVFNSNEAVEEWKVENMGEGVLDGGDVNTVYR